MGKVKISLIGFEPLEVDVLKDDLLASTSVTQVEQPVDLHASAQDVLSAVLTDTTLVAHIAEQATSIAASLAALTAVVRKWRAKQPQREGQHVEMSGPHSNSD